MFSQRNYIYLYIVVPILILLQYDICTLDLDDAPIFVKINILHGRITTLHGPY